MTEFKEDVSIVLGGAAGQGIQTVEGILTYALKRSGYHVYANKEYMSRVRGGINTTEIRVSSRRVRAFVKRIDILVPFKQGVLSWVSDRLSENTVVLGERENVEEGFLGRVNLVEVPPHEARPRNREPALHQHDRGRPDSRPLPRRLRGCRGVHKEAFREQG